MSELRFTNRTAVITGAGRGLGRAYAMLLAARGARVVVSDNGSALGGEGSDRGPADETVAAIRAAGGEAVACSESVADAAGARAAVQSALDHFGRLDILIHSAGNSRYAALDAMEDAELEAVLGVHLLGAFHLVRAAFPIMAAAGYGRVVLTGSIGGLYGMRQVAHYGAAKGGTAGLNNVLAIEGAAVGIRSNMIIPAAVTRMAEGLDTTRYPPMAPELVAPVVGWLAHESCSVSGEMFISAAGRVARALVAETPGVFRPDWTIEQIDTDIGHIRDPKSLWTLHPLEDAFTEHLDRSFAMARAGLAEGA